MSSTLEIGLIFSCFHDCEIATHDKFKELMADTEIFIDGVATKRFNDLNSSLETVRTLSAAQVGEKDFFCHVTHKTWDSIIKDIRKNHEQDIDSIPEDEKEFLIKLFKKSPIIKNSGLNFRKKIVYNNSLIIHSVLIIVNKLDNLYFIFELILYWNNFSYRIQLHL